jgi:hypothetical protein
VSKYLSVADIKKLRFSPYYNKERKPKEGSKTRRIYDKFVNGEEVCLSSPERVNPCCLEHLRNFYDLDIRYVRKGTYKLNDNGIARF